MSTIAAYRAAQWVPIIGTILFLKASLPELILILPGLVKPFLLKSYFAIHEAVTLIWSNYNLLFLTVILLRYFRLAVNLFAYLFVYQHDEIPEHPTVTSDMAHVIIPTAEPTNSDFFRCVLSVLEKRPGWITVVTAHRDQTAQAREVLANLPVQHHTLISVTTGPMANKRQQVAHVIRGLARNREQNKDVLVVLVDDHVWWPSAKFLSAVIAPFEDPNVGIVAMHKRPERARGNGFSDSLLNFIACLYLERHNFEVCSSNAIDGSAFVVSGRTCVLRASIVMEDDFLTEYLDEHFFFGKFGPLNPDDDNYITRYMVRNNWDIKWQHQPEALMETSLGVAGGYTKFWGQIQRWARSQWRSNPCTVFTDGSIWRRGQFWGACGHIMSFLNFALVWDSLIIYLWSQSSYAGFKFYQAALLILGSKFVKVAPFFWHNPQDLWLFPFQVLFGYFHSFVKLWALLTFYDHSWSGRNLAALDNDNDGPDDGPDGGPDDGHNGGSDDNNAGDDQDSNGDDEDDSDNDGFRRKSFAPSSSQSWKKASSKNSNYGKSTDLWTDGNTVVCYRPVAYQHESQFAKISTPWGYTNLSETHQVPANVREGHYTSSISQGFYGTPRTTIRSSSQPRNDRAISEPVTRITGYTATNENPRGRTLSRDYVPQTSKQDSLPPTLYTRGVDLEHTSAACEFKTPPRTQYYPRVPDAPRKTSIALQGANTSPFQDKDVSVRRLELLRGPIGKVPKYAYNRQFPRGDDCQRTHPDASYLSVRKGSSTRRCRSPQPNRYSVVSGRSRLQGR